jgi:hypothetical protein
MAPMTPTKTQLTTPAQPNRATSRRPHHSGGRRSKEEGSLITPQYCAEKPLRESGIPPHQPRGNGRLQPSPVESQAKSTVSTAPR